MVPTLETERLTLRAWRQADLEAFATYYADRATAAFVGGTCSRNTAWHRMAAFADHWSLRGYGYWGLLNTAQGKGGNLGCGRVPDHRAERVRLGAAPIVWLDWDKISRGDADLKGSVGRAALTAARRIRQRQKPHPACPRDLN